MLQVVQYKQKLEYQDVKKQAYEKHWSFVLEQTERYTKDITSTLTQPTPSGASSTADGRASAASGAASAAAPADAMDQNGDKGWCLANGLFSPHPSLLSPNRLSQISCLTTLQSKTTRAPSEPRTSPATPKPRSDGRCVLSVCVVVLTC